MKLRQGFVSNSSSSSFIIALKEKPSSPEELQKILFGDSEILGAYGDPISTADAAKTIFGDLTPLGKKSNAEIFIERIEPASWSPPLEEIIEELGNGTPYGETSLQEPEYPNSNFEYGSPEYKKEMEKYYEDKEVYYKDMANNFVKKTEGMLYFTVEYSDNDGNYFSTLEHGGTFDNIPHIHVSKH